MGSGEYYDRLSPPLERMADNYSSPSAYYSTQNLTSDRHSWYDHGRDYSSLDRRGIARYVSHLKRSPEMLSVHVIHSSPTR